MYDPSTNVQGHTELAERMKKNILLIFILIIFSLSSILPLLHSGFFPTDDGNWMIIRFSAFYEALRNGQFPVRFLPRLNNGYGYPVADFLYPLFMYIGVPIHVLGFSFVDTIKIILGLSMIGSTLFAYLWLSRLFNKFSSFIGAITYLYAPYHLYDVYKRGSVGEVLALAIVPFILWQLERKSLFWSSIGIALLILSHNTLAVLFLPLGILYVALDIFIAKNRRRLLYYYTSILVLGLGISSFFWIPAVFDLQYTIFSQTSISDWSKYFANWELIGVSSLSVFMVTFLFFVIRAIKVQKHRLTALFFIVGVFSVFLASSLSAPLWNLLPVSFIQFPFRFLSLTMLCVSFLTACVVSVFSGKKRIIIAALILILAIFSSKPFMYPKVFQNYPETFYSTNMDTTTVKNEYMPKWVKEIPVSIYNEKVEVINGDGKIQNLFNNGNNISFDISSSTGNEIQINTVYFPGWDVEENGKKIPVSYKNRDGAIRFKVAKGSNFVKASFTETPVRIVSDLISLLSLILLVLGIKNKKIFYKS